MGQELQRQEEYRRPSPLLVADGEIEITHAEFGFQPYSAFLGAVRNREDMQIHFEIDAAAESGAG